MKASQITNLLLLLLAALFLSAVPALAQNPKQELNDQLSTAICFIPAQTREC